MFALGSVRSVRRSALAVLALGGVVSTLAMLTGCGPQPRSAAAVEPDHDASPRVVALLPFAADQLIAMGVPPVAVPSIDGGGPLSWDGIPTITLDHSAGPNLEQLIASGPDVIVTGGTYAQFLTTMQSTTGAEIVVMDIESIEDVTTHLGTLGRLVDREDAAADLAASLTAGVSGTQGAAEPAEPAEPVSVLAVFGTPHAFYAFLPDSYLGDLIEHAGGELITHDMESHSVFRGLAPLSMEVVIARDPDHLLVIFHGSDEAARAMLRADPLWAGLTAVRSDRVTYLSDDLYAMRPGSEMPRAVAEIRGVISGSGADRP